MLGLESLVFWLYIGVRNVLINVGRNWGVMPDRRAIT